jgi:energy-coupling factor transport system substrate-specific component
VFYLESQGKRYYPSDKNEVTLPSSVKTVRIRGYALTYSIQNPMLSYYLDGFDKEATLVSKEDMGPVRYTNLAGGNYTYELAVVSTSTGEKQQSIELSINKEKAFYEQIWFYILALLLIALIIVLIVRIYLRFKMKALKKKEEKQRVLIREIVTAFSKTIDMKDKYTKGHSGRVAHYTAMLARELGYDEETVEEYYNIALLHDIGKIGIPGEVLNKPGKLTDEEYEIIKSHSSLGHDVLKDISIMPELAIGAGSHHERPDGKGYPEGLKGDEIPRVAQIIAVADTFDAMYSNRPYRKRMNFDRAVSIIKSVSGVQLAPDVVDAFLRLVEKGEFKAPNDKGGGSLEDIDNIHKKFEKEK